MPLLKPATAARAAALGFRAVAPRGRLLEKEHVENPVVRWADDNGVPSYKMNGRGQRSWPDRQFFIPGGRPLFIEFKKPGEDPTELQNKNHRMLRGLGYAVEVVDDPTIGVCLIAEAMDAARVPKKGREVAVGTRRGNAAVRPRSR
jgi:hypothetical protein